MHEQKILAAYAELPPREIDTHEALVREVGTMGGRCFWHARIVEPPRVDVKMVTVVNFVDREPKRVVYRDEGGLSRETHTNALLGVLSGLFTTREKACAYAREVEEILAARQYVQTV